jgi:hypothetical protein
VDWAAPPRAPKEFFAKFTPPKTAAKWTSRLKCNVYFYRTNYFIILGLVLTAAFVRNPAALLAVALLCFDLLLFNDTFATSVRCLPRLTPPDAAWLSLPGSAPTHGNVTNTGRTCEGTSLMQRFSHTGHLGSSPPPPPSQLSSRTALRVERLERLQLNGVFTLSRVTHAPSRPLTPVSCD